jgi:hypothetical protein
MTAPHTEGSRIPDQQPQPAENGTPLTAQQQADLSDADTQARYLAEFNEQMRRIYCPGCGEG